MKTAVSQVLRSIGSERGQILPIVVILIAVLAGATALTVDLGSYSTQRRDLQNAADAIALAASQELPDPAAALSTADEWAINNGIDPATMTVTITQQNLPSVPNPQVKVSITKNHEFTFARLIGIDDAEVQASGTAIKTSPGGSAGLMPWSVKEEVKALAAPGDPVVLKYDSTNGDTGNFGTLALDGSGASDYEAAVQYGSNIIVCAAGVDDCEGPSVVDTKPGNMTGPTRDGTDYRMDSSALECDTWEEVVTIAPDGSHGLKAECNPFTPGGNSESLRVIIIPVIAGEFYGRSDVTITEFALFFLEGYGPGGCTGNACEVTGRFIKSNTNYGAVAGIFDEGTFAHFVRLIE